jgi:hypothetical protein
VLALLLAGCDALLYGPEPAADPETIIDLMWREVDLHYAAFAEKGVDWDAVRATYRPRVGPHTTQGELRATAIAMLSELRDGHVSLSTPQGVWAWDGWWADHPENYDPGVVREYIEGGLTGTPGGRITYGRLVGGFGYLHIRDFTGAGWAGDIDRALSSLADVPGLVLDVRGNGGGTDKLMNPIAGRFADRKRHFETVYFRAGPAHDDFHEGIEHFIEPLGERRFTGPTMLLTNRRVFSAGEAFVSALSVLPHVTVVGDTTGGGAGNPINRELPNGWSFRVPRSKSLTASGLNYEGVGLPPDVPVQIDEADVAAGRDSILERAMALLGG